MALIYVPKQVKKPSKCNEVILKQKYNILVKTNHP